MAGHLASIFGTERDRVNCPFYFKIGACRHGARCSRAHTAPLSAVTLRFPGMYVKPGPAGDERAAADARSAEAASQKDAHATKEAKKHFEDFYEDVFEELDGFGELEGLHVCDNVCEHLSGSVYAKFRDESAARAALAGLQGRYYEGRPIVAEFSPVTDFWEASCRQYEERTCNRGGQCNFMHLHPVSSSLKRELFGRYGRSRDRDDDRHCRPTGGGGGGGGGGYRRRSRSRSRSPPPHRRPPRDDDDGRGRRRDRNDERDANRESSEERRARIRAWNEEKRRQREADGAGAAKGAGAGAAP